MFIIVGSLLSCCTLRNLIKTKNDIKYIIQDTRESQSVDKAFQVKRYKLATIRKGRNQKKIPTPKAEVEKTKLTIRYLYHENIS